MDLYRLLTVDDEPHIHAGLDAIIDWRSHGFEHVAAALNGEDALGLVTDVHPDVVFTDIRMPGLSGLELIEAIRRRSGPQPVIIVVSGYDDFEYARTALRHRVEDYLLKPIDEDEVARVLADARNALTRRASASSPGVAVTGGESAVRTLLSGKGDEDVVREARAEVASAVGSRLAVVCMYRLRTDMDDAPLSAAEVRAALLETKARDSSRWVVDDEAVTALLMVPRSAGDSYLAWMKGLHNSVEVHLGRPVVLCAGRPFDDVGSIPRELATVKDSMLGAPPALPREVRIADGVSRTGLRRLPVDAIVAAFEGADAKGARDEIAALLKRAEDEAVSVASIREWMAELRIEVARLVADLGGDSAGADDRLRRAAEQAHGLSLSAIGTIADAFVERTADEIAELSRSSRDGVVALVRRRIEREYAGDISLTGLAEQYGMNAVYLGQLFRKRTGEGFKTALRRRRVREARRLLRSTDLLIPRIARAVGYRDTDFFTDQFRRETGVTPGQFRALEDAGVPLEPRSAVSRDSDPTGRS